MFRLRYGYKILFYFQTKIDNRLKHILGLHPSNEPQLYKTEPSKPEFFTPRHENIETMLEDHVFKKTQISPSLPCTTVYAYKLPDFFKHKECTCNFCDDPKTFVIACTTFGLESSMYYRAKEMEIARNYFEGTTESFVYAENKLKSYFKRCRDDSPGYIVDMVEREVYNEFKRVQVEIFIEMAFFELSQGDHGKADDCIVRLHEILQDMTTADDYLRNEVLNLMIASAQLRKAAVKPFETGLEVEMDSLKLSPRGEPPKTPINKANCPPKIVKNIVKDEELPSVKRKVIKLNFDEVNDEKEPKKPVRKRSEFKIPVPVTMKPVLENITPRPRRKPDILVTKPSDDVKMTPTVEQTEFFTPNSTPSESFFTPMTSVKTYSKKSLRSTIVKNLEAEFSTPKADKENSALNTVDKFLDVPKPSGRAARSKVDKKTLKRATSPGKLIKEVKPTRSRLKKPTSFKVHEDDVK
ncbi:unnamed protein product [Diatraea saccharalis]|uniref:Uncharacterized protein n=1 Tax=Diatraea saccharalis TaxID=40085 RepID=A0A9N9WEL9_9NEOP|nr:unnamed protein product [Diatraea saccharalis]